MILSKDLLSFQEPVDTRNIDTWAQFSEENRSKIIQQLNSTTTIDEAKDIITKINNKSLYDFFVLCSSFPDDLGEGMGLFAHDNTKFKYELRDVISALSSS